MPQYQSWLAILATHATQTADGWLCADGPTLNAINMWLATGTYVVEPLPTDPAATQIVAAKPKPWAKFLPRAAVIASGPGDVVKIVLEKMGHKSAGGCGCEAMRQKMNAWGYWGCLKHRAELVEWFTAKAKEAKIEIDGDGIWALLAAGLQYWWKPDPAKPLESQ